MQTVKVIKLALKLQLQKTEKSHKNQKNLKFFKIFPVNPTFSPSLLYLTSCKSNT
jgi:hypothetical protein